MQLISTLMMATTHQAQVILHRTKKIQRISIIIPPVYALNFYLPPLSSISKLIATPTCTDKGYANIYSINIQYRIRLARTQVEPNFHRPKTARERQKRTTVTATNSSRRHRNLSSLFLCWVRANWALGALAQMERRA
jgi:hypothetical protein